MNLLALQYLPELHAHSQKERAQKLSKFEVQIWKFVTTALFLFNFYHGKTKYKLTGNIFAFWLMVTVD